MSLNILMIHPHDIYSNQEPWTVRIVYIAKELIKKGHEVRLVYFPLDRSAIRKEEQYGGFFVIPLSRKFGPKILLANIFRVACLARWSDIIHFQKCFYHAALPALIASFLFNKHVHYDWDDWELKIYNVSTEPGLLRNLIGFFLSFLENNIPRLADTVSVASERLKIRCLSLGVQECNIFQAPVGADIEKFNPRVSADTLRKKYNINSLLVLYLGQLHGGQYVELFIKAACELLRRCPGSNIRFMIVGDGYMRDELEKKTNQLGLVQSVIFTGSIAHESVPEYLAAANICVASFEDNEVTKCKSPLKIVEYMAMGKAIVASKVGEVSKMLHKSAILVEPGNYIKLAEGIMTLIDNPSLMRELGIKSRERAENIYNWARTTNNILNAYNVSLRKKTGIVSHDQL
ncbi:MAG: glycosyltransferase family 4 protein [Candidatus Omnitrophota bacterium]|nr:glycosyltransferase family 4 protein [Candidatus Omnitrophota bacterium]